jgi:hypothetical protein
MSHSDPTGLIPVSCQCESTVLFGPEPGYGGPPGGIGPSHSVRINATLGQIRKDCRAACRPDGLAGIRIPRPTPAALCADVNFKKCGACTLADCERLIEELYLEVDTTPQPFGVNKCEKWVHFLEPHLPIDKCAGYEYVLFRYPGIIGLWVVPLQHVAIRVTMCDGTVFYVDQGWWGGGDHFVAPIEVDDSIAVEVGAVGVNLPEIIIRHK